MRWFLGLVLSSALACAPSAVLGPQAAAPREPAPAAVIEPRAPTPSTPPPPTTLQTRDGGLSGSWSGAYVYVTRGVGGAPGGPTTVSFFAELEVDRDHVHGSVVEPNTFDDDVDGELRATLDGVIDPDGLVRFTKRYDGASGVSHIVEYVGRLDPAAARIEGTWSTASSTGRFVMKRDRPLPQVARLGRTHLSRVQ